jgi:hypothetical protein
MSKIVGNMAGCYSPLGKTFVITDENGNELTGVVTAQEKIFTATDNDVREGMVYATDSGASIGTKDIPAYYTTTGMVWIRAGYDFNIPLPMKNQYDYTKLQCIICPFNTAIKNSVAAEKVALNDNIYETGSTTPIAEITKDANTKCINLNITNSTNIDYFIYFFTYREEV